MAKLILHSEETSREFMLDGETVIGRQSASTIQINEKKASRQHAKVVRVGAEFLVEDLNSSNGTRVNGRKITRCTLQHGDTIQIGGTRLVFESEKKADPALAAGETGGAGIPTSSGRTRTGSSSDPMIGKTLGGYKILSKLGQGGMGTVYRAQQISMDRVVALKVMKKELSQNKEFAKGFLKEARTAGQLTHPAIVQVHDVGEEDGTLYFSMEYVEGEPVIAMLKREGRLEIGQALDIAIGVCEALIHAGNHRIVHQDIKPHNIMVEKRGNVKVADLGLATTGDRASDKEKKDKKIMGTPHYMAPEQSQREPIDGRTDLYALGCTLFYMLTGRVPFDGPNSLAVITKHITQERPDPREDNATVPKDLAELVMRLMAIKKEDRPANPKEVLDELKVLKTDWSRGAKAPEKKAGLVKKRARRSRGGFRMPSKPRITLPAPAANGPAVATAPVGPAANAMADGKTESDFEIETVARDTGRMPTRRRPQKQGVSTGVLVLFLVFAAYMAFHFLGGSRRPVQTRRPPPPPSDGTIPIVPIPPSPTPAGKTEAAGNGGKTHTPASNPAEDAAWQDLRKAMDSRDKLIASGNFAAARTAFRDVMDRHRGTAASAEAMQEQRKTEDSITKILDGILQDAKTAAGKKNYRLATAKCTRLISADDRSRHAGEAKALLGQMDAEAQPRFDELIKASGDALAANNLKEARAKIDQGLDELGGTKWTEKLSARQLELILATKFIRAMDKARGRQTVDGKPPHLTITWFGDKPEDVLVAGIADLNLKLSDGKATVSQPLSKLDTKGLEDFVRALGLQNDHLGFANLLLVLGRGDDAQRELQRSMEDDTQSETAAQQAAAFAGASNLHVFDFGNWQHQLAWEAPYGAWSMDNGRYVLESPEGGDTLLKTEAIGGPFNGRNGRIAFEFSAQEPKDGYYVAMEFGGDQRNVTVLFNAEGCLLQANAGQVASAKSDWGFTAGHTTRVELAIKNNAVTVTVDGKAASPLQASGLDDLRGTIAFRIRETKAVLDNISLRTIKE
ncbi:MAG: serine/threonine-protein kinase [Planctomycetes bacterium]|nr:serine/threonine-protein kinase [Planctomycetota bacterium]